MVKPSIPHIYISLAPPEEPQVEPYSPFASSNMPASAEDGFRLTHLTPPLTSTRFRKSLSPLRPLEAPATKGLERDRFDMLLKASRERHAAVGAKKAQDLRKEIALKAHKTKQVERRALFLSKVLAPPSPTAVSTPKTPPDSPAIFHYSLPSPGLVSPLSMFESLTNDDGSCDGFMSREPWVEQVDFRLPDHLKTITLDAAPKVSLKGLLPQKSKTGKHIPSLDQISARLSINGQSSAPTVQFEPSRRSSTKFPAFLQVKSQEPGSSPAVEDGTIIKPKPRLSIGVGRLQMPVRAPPINSPKPIKAELLPPLSPRSPVQPNLTITTLVVPRTSTVSPTKFSESNLLALESRGRKSRDMRMALKLEATPSDDSRNGHDEDEEDKKKWRRQSCPPELGRHKARGGFEHPVLTLPGGF
jgi:hypothetical protein